MENKRCKWMGPEWTETEWTETKRTETERTETKRTETERTETERKKAQRIETEQDGIKVILEFPERAGGESKDAEKKEKDGSENRVDSSVKDAHEEAVRQEIRTFLVDMLREHFRKNAGQGGGKDSGEAVPEGADAL